MTRLLRGLVKTGIATSLQLSGVHKLLSRGNSARQMPLVIGYHRVVEDFNLSARYTIPPMLTSVKTFERQLDWLGHRYDFISLDDVAAWIDGSKKFSGRPMAAITFDDGYADLYHHAFPILKRKGIPAAVFAVTDLIGTNTLQTYDELYLLLMLGISRWREPHRTLLPLLVDLELPPQLLKKISRISRNAFQITLALLNTLPQVKLMRLIESLRYRVSLPESLEGTVTELRAMTWDMLREMSRECFTVGAHTLTHPRLTLENRNKVIEETRDSRLEAERKLGAAVEHFAYPSGAFNADVVRAVADAGYRCAYTTCQHRDPQYPALTIPRRLWWEKSCVDAFGKFSSAVMSSQVNGVFDFKSSCGQTHEL